MIPPKIRRGEQLEEEGVANLKKGNCEKQYNIPKRYVVALLGFLGLSCTYAMQVDLNVTILAMSTTSHGYSKNGTKSFVECPMLVEAEDRPRSTKYLGQRYEWSYKEQAVILGSFYYGYLLTLLPGGYLAQAFSAKWVFGLGIFFSGLLSLLTPTVAAMGAIPLVILRISQGLFQ
ncbi:hypothetical protein TNIN_499541, partial [Trichonephila inaurata madagascariensis]